MPHDESLVARHEGEFTRVWQQIGSLGNRMTAVEGTVDRLDEDFYNHGRDGIKTQFQALVNQTIGARQQQAKEHEQNTAKLNLIVALCAVATLVVLAVSVIVTVEFSRRSDLDPAKIFHSSAPVRVYAKTNDSQHATIPQLGR